MYFVQSQTLSYFLSQQMASRLTVLLFRLKTLARCFQFHLRNRVQNFIPIADLLLYKRSFEMSERRCLGNPDRHRR